MYCILLSYFVNWYALGCPRPSNSHRENCYISSMDMYGSLSNHISYCYWEGEYPNVSMLPYTLDFMDSSKNLTRLTKFFRIQRKQEYIPWIPTLKLFVGASQS